MNTSFFSNDYSEARERFLSSASAVDAEISSYPIDYASDIGLNVDVAVIGPDSARTTIVSSGVHGVEGFVGSAIQLSLMDQLKTNRFEDQTRFVLIHGLNPYGFAYLRRFDENGIDLNRNFLSETESFTGASKAYRELNAFLNPQSPPAALEPFLMKALWLIWKNGLQTMKEAVARGQYEFPSGLFFGGKRPSESNRIVHDHVRRWIGRARSVLHFDIHSGLGSFGEYKLLLNENDASPEYQWYADTFGVEHVESVAEPEGTAYKVSGMFCDWLQQFLSDLDYRSVGVEFGTYNVIRVLASIRAENRAHHYDHEGSATFRRAKDELLECFCPKSLVWRQRVVRAGINVILQGVKAQQQLGIRQKEHDLVSI